MNPGQIYDAYRIINELAHQALGDNALQAVDTSSFVAVGEKILKTGYENTLNAISAVLFRTIFSQRPYKGSLDIMRVSEQRYGAITRKINFAFSDDEPSQDVNISGITGYPDEPGVTNLADGQSVDMYKIKNPKVIQLNFYGQQALQDHITRYVHQLDQAFKSESEFMQFIGAMLVQFFNSIEVKNEARARGVLLNRIAGQMSMGLATVDLVEAYNTENGTTYTRSQLLDADHITKFMQYVAAEIMVYSDRLKDMTTDLYHANISGTPKIPRHTPKARQKMIMYSPLFRKAEAQVYSGIFNPEYLKIGDFESVNFWQSQSNPSAINITPSILDTTTGANVKASAAVQSDYVLGLLFDEEALGWVPIFDRAASTPLNAAALYWNTYYHWLFNAYNDYTENAVVFVLGEGGAGQTDQRHIVMDSGELNTETSIASVGTVVKVNATTTPSGPVEIQNAYQTDLSVRNVSTRSDVQAANEPKSAAKVPK